MQCLNYGMEMEQGTVDGFGQGWKAWYEFTSDDEKKKKGIKGFLTRNIVTVTPHGSEHQAWHCPKCRKVLMWMDAQE